MYFFFHWKCEIKLSLSVFPAKPGLGNITNHLLFIESLASFHMGTTVFHASRCCLLVKTILSPYTEPWGPNLCGAGDLLILNSTVYSDKGLSGYHFLCKVLHGYPMQDYHCAWVRSHSTIEILTATCYQVRKTSFWFLTGFWGGRPPCHLSYTNDVRMFIETAMSLW